MSDLVGNPEDRFSRVAAQLCNRLPATEDYKHVFDSYFASGKHVRVIYTPLYPTFI